MTSPQETADNLRFGFKSMGLGTRYYERSLKSCGPVGEHLYGWFQTDDAVLELRQGRGRSFFGPPGQTNDLFMLAARACYLAGIKTKIVSLSILIQEASGSSIDIDLDEAHVLFLWPLFRTDYKDTPMTNYQRLAVEDFLVERLNNDRGLFTLSDGPLDRALSWWSPTLISHLKMRNEEIEVA